jgi:hypothetical protein
LYPALGFVWQKRVRAPSFFLKQVRAPSFNTVKKVEECMELPSKICTVAYYNMADEIHINQNAPE